MKQNRSSPRYIFFLHYAEYVFAPLNPLGIGIDVRGRRVGTVYAPVYTARFGLGDVNLFRVKPATVVERI